MQLVQGEALGINTGCYTGRGREQKARNSATIIKASAGQNLRVVGWEKLTRLCKLFTYW